LAKEARAAFSITSRVRDDAGDLRGISLLLFGWLIESGSAWQVSFGYGIAAVPILLAALTELKFGVDAEGKPLESIADPLSH
jgi:hypothetical protein